jgi:hypothetical protein
LPVDATKREVEKVMSRFSRPILLDRQFDDEETLPGGCLMGLHFRRYMTLETGEKLLLIRYWLQDMYGDEFSRTNVAKRVGISYQGIANVEERKRKSHYKITITDLIGEYKVPKEIILNNFEEKEFPVGIYIGKPQDMATYFYYYYLENGLNHVLDQTDYSKFDWGDHTGELQEVEVEFFMKVKDPDTGETLNSRNIAQVKLLADDLNRISDIIIRDIEIVAYKHNEIIRLREEIFELEQLLNAKERGTINPRINNDTVQALKELIKAKQGQQ